MTDTSTQTRREQRQTVLLHLMRVGPITQEEALEQYRIWRLASRISELVKGGWNIEKERLPGNFVRYNLDPSRPRIEDVQPRLPFDEGSADR